MNNQENDISFGNINASSLFHFTKELSTLKLILQNGVRFSYAFENYPQSVISNFCDITDITNTNEDLGVAIPMASFCDIPITRASEHMQKYGYYMVGFNKAFMRKYCGNILNPLLYVQSANLTDAIIDLSCIYKESSNEHQALISNDKTNEYRIPELGLRKYYLRLLIGLTKPMFSSDGKKCYYDEREWRAFHDDNKGQFNEWKWAISESEYKKEKKALNDNISSTSDGYITFYEDCLQEAITHIVVKSDEELPELAKYILKATKLFGFEGISDDTKLNLISKISSIKRFSLDY